MCPSALFQHEIMDNSTTEHLHPFVVIEDLKFKRRMREGEVGIDPSLIAFAK